MSKFYFLSENSEITLYRNKCLGIFKKYKLNIIFLLIKVINSYLYNFCYYFIWFWKKEKSIKFLENLKKEDTIDILIKIL